MSGFGLLFVKVKVKGNQIGIAIVSLRDTKSKFKSNAKKYSKFFSLEQELRRSRKILLTLTEKISTLTLEVGV